jgi:DNA-binding LytR/AlgR family response regulator
MPAHQNIHASNLRKSAKSKQFVFIKSEYKIIKVRYEDIVFCEGMKDYTQVHLKGKVNPLLTLHNLKSFLSNIKEIKRMAKAKADFFIAINFGITMQKKNRGRKK